MVKRISVMMLALCLMLNVNALAVMPMADTGIDCDPGFSITGSTAKCSLTVRAPESSARITATVTLLKSDGEGVPLGRSERNRNPTIQRQLYQQQSHHRLDLPHGVFCAGGRK